MYVHFVFYHRLQAELEEAREEARIKAQEEIVVKIQEAKVRIVTVDNFKGICHFKCGYMKFRLS